jgi:hypothetical protein
MPSPMIPTSIQFLITSIIIVFVLLLVITLSCA